MRRAAAPSRNSPTTSAATASSSRSNRFARPRPAPPPRVAPAKPLPSAHRIEALEISEVAAEKKAAAKKDDKGGAPGAESSSIRVSIEKVDQLINLIGELVITQAMIEQRSDGLDPMVHERLLNSVSAS